jgi:hypothetical protein
MSGDQAFKDADMIEEGYPTPYVGNRTDVDTIAATLAKSLKPVFADHNEVIFICHSLGGLIIKQMLLDNPQYAEKTPFIAPGRVLFWTPISFCGQYLDSESGSYWRPMKTRPASILPMPASTMLEDTFLNFRYVAGRM